MHVKMPTDKYDSLAALEKHLGQSVYRVRLLDRAAPVTIVSPHGGFIEPGTSAIARAIAGRRHNLFDFQGLKTPGAFVLHITATRFRHPDLTRLLDASRAAVSIHSMGRAGVATIWLGGLNGPLKDLVLANLERSAFHVCADSPYFRGESADNFVNMCAERGVQLELSDELKDQLFRGPQFSLKGQSDTTPRFREMVTAVRRAIRSYERAPMLERKIA